MAHITTLFLSSMEWLAKYGFIDIALAAGLFGALSRLFRSKTVSEIDGLEILISVATDNILVIELQNQTSQPIYIYRQYFAPGYHLSYTEGGWRTYLIYMWTNKSCVEFAATEPRNHNGQIILRPVRDDGTAYSPPFLEPKASLKYNLELSETEPHVHKRLIAGKLGLLTVSLIHGTEVKVLQRAM
jgi:hypothetical protein